MTGLHEVAALAVVAAATLLTVAALLAAVFDRGHAAMPRLAWAFTGLAVAQAAIGVVLLATGREARETLHMLYALALVGVMPLALNFAEDAPDRARSAVVAAAGVAALLVCWRLFATG